MGRGKTQEQILGIAKALLEKDARDILITRLDPEKAAFLEGKLPFIYYPLPRIGVAAPRENRPELGCVVVATGGTSDMPVAEEAARTAQVLGSQVIRLYDVGVAGLHRLLAQGDTLLKARAVVAVAGMEGALASVIGGAGGLPGDRRAHQRGLWGQLRRAQRPVMYAQFLRQRGERGEHRQWIRRGLSGPYDQPFGGNEYMKTLYLDCRMGAAGDMLMGALLDLHPDPDGFLAGSTAWAYPA